MLNYKVTAASISRMEVMITGECRISGFVVTSQPQNSPWKTANIAIGVNRIAEYAQEIHYNGYSPGSRTDSWQENAFGLDSSQLNGFEEGLAYTSGAIYDFESIMSMRMTMISVLAIISTKMNTLLYVAAIQKFFSARVQISAEYSCSVLP
jgi:hypothetical protein